MDSSESRFLGQKKSVHWSKEEGRNIYTHASEGGERKEWDAKGGRWRFMVHSHLLLQVELLFVFFGAFPLDRFPVPVLRDHIVVAGCEVDTHCRDLRLYAGVRGHLPHHHRVGVHATHPSQCEVLVALLPVTAEQFYRRTPHRARHIPAIASSNAFARRLSSAKLLYVT